jgi:hypothetical protein
MEKEIEKIRQAADLYVKACWPKGCPEAQKTDIKLAFYAGMLFMFGEVSDTADRHDDETDGAEAMERLIHGVVKEANVLNASRMGPNPLPDIPAPKRRGG